MSYTYDHGGNVFTLARQLGVLPEEITDFSASINPLGMPPLVKKALTSALDSLVHYPDSSHHDLKQALARHHGLSPGNFVIANGSTELIYHLPGVVHGKRALIVAPSFSEYVRSLNQHRWDTRNFTLSPENSFDLDLDALERTLAEGFDAFYLCNPGNPSGQLYPLDVIERVYSICAASGTFLVLDEAFMDFCEETSAKQLIVRSDNGIVLRSMTKFFGIPGLRLGYAIACDTLTEQLDAMGGPWSVNTLALTAGVAALQDNKHIRQTSELIRQERNYLLDQLTTLPTLRVYPSSANYLLVEIISGITATELKERLVQRRILIRDCATFMGLTSGFFRIAVRTREENSRLVGCLKEILDFGG